MAYCSSRFATLRRPTVEVNIGAVGVGGSHPIRLQSMTTSDTQDVEATVRQAVALAEVGCEIVRVTAPNVPAAKCLRDIRKGLDKAGFDRVPLVADIHFLPQAALEAVEHVEKVRINPGNYADKKRFAVREYSDRDYQTELERLHQSVAPLVRRCRELGRSLRIGTNHGSLSDRILNRYGDSPMGMVESALEFVRICETEGFHDLILSMKASNPKVVIQAYRLLVERMDAAHRPYPLHLGVTEAGDGEDGRIKSAIGIGSLLADGLGDTIRVSLTEDSVYEIPVARALAEKAMARWTLKTQGPEKADPLDPFHYRRRSTTSCRLGAAEAGSQHPPRVITPYLYSETSHEGNGTPVVQASEDTPVEALLAPTSQRLPYREAARVLAVPNDAAGQTPEALASSLRKGDLLLFKPESGEEERLARLATLGRQKGFALVLDADATRLAKLGPVLQALGPEALIATLSDHCLSSQPGEHAIGAYRKLAAELKRLGLELPIWIRCTEANSLQAGDSFLSKLLEASILAGSLLCDGIGDFLSVELGLDPSRSHQLAYNVLQGAGVRISKTEYVACPSCGRTLFDLQSTTQRIRSQTIHLKGVKIAIMGCIVNGPGEMADADFGYVGGAPGRINLYVGKTCVQYNIPQEEADAHLIRLIKNHGKWTEPRPSATGA